MDAWTSHEYFDAALKAAEAGRSDEAYCMWVMGELFHDDEAVEIEEMLQAMAISAEVAERQQVKREYRQRGRISSCPMAVSMALVGRG